MRTGHRRKDAQRKSAIEFRASAIEFRASYTPFIPPGTVVRVPIDLTMIAGKPQPVATSNLWTDVARAGVGFIDENGRGAGVRLRKRR